MKICNLPTKNTYTLALRNNELIDVTHEFSVREPNLSIQHKPTAKVFVERFSSADPLLKEALTTLCKSNPSLLTANIRFDNNPPKTVADFINTHHETKMLYHGTSSKLLDNILKEGLTLNNEAHYYTTASNPSLRGRVYLCNENGIGAAKFAANSACAKYGGEPVYLAININDLNHTLLLPDEDSNKETWEESLNYTGCLSYMSEIESNKISIANEEFFPDMSKYTNTKKQKPRRPKP